MGLTFRVARVALILAPWGPMALAQNGPVNPAFVPVPPPVPDPGRPGQVVTLPGGGTATVTGGTPFFQNLQTPGGGGAVMLPNGNGTSTVVGPGGQGGIVKPP